MDSSKNDCRKVKEGVWNPVIEISGKLDDTIQIVIVIVFVVEIDV